MRSKLLPLPLAAALLLAGCASTAPSPMMDNPLLGTWRLMSLQGQPQGEAPLELWGKQPSGYLVITPQRLVAILTAQGRKVPVPPFTPQDLVASFVSQSAYTGPWRVDGNRLITKVDTSSYSTWVGTEQVREFTVEGRRLMLTSPAMALPPPAAGKTGTMRLVWEKVE
jgi:hypothetical protein